MKLLVSPTSTFPLILTPNRSLSHTDRLGSKVQGIKQGGRYAIASIGGCIKSLAQAAGVTKASQPADEFLSLPLFGIGADGGHAEYAVVDQGQLVPVVSLYQSLSL